MGEKKTRAAERSGRTAPSSKRDRLAPGELDKLVLGYMRRHKKDAAHTASAVAKESSAPRGRWPTASAAKRRRGRCGWSNRSRANTSWPSPRRARKGIQCLIQRCRPSECPTA
jgi:hypothetical protein